MGSPYLNFVFTGSNAGYGGDFISRMQACLDNLYLLAERHELDCDVTVVEWNPPADRPRIVDALEWNSTRIETKVITVPQTTHDNVPNPRGEKFFEYWAKNVGIRRAAGEFVLSTNPDNIYSESLIARLAKHDLDSGCFYRVNRSDTQAGKVFITHYKTAPELHFNGSGDFILMHRDAWESIHGHPEVPYSLTVDGQTVYLADKAGLKQVILPEPMYHQDHSRTPKYYDPWDDLAPHGKKNDNSWGMPEADFETRYL